MLAHAAASLLSSPIRMVKATRRTIDAAGRRLPASSPPPSPFAAPARRMTLPLTPAAGVRHDLAAGGEGHQGPPRREGEATSLALCPQHSGGGSTIGARSCPARSWPWSCRCGPKKGAMETGMLVSLATEVSDPGVRLHGASSATPRGGQGAPRHRPRHTDWAEFAAAGGSGRPPLLPHAPGPTCTGRCSNVTISNVPGPPFPLSGPAPAWWPTTPMGPIFDSRLNMTVMSYQEHSTSDCRATPSCSVTRGSWPASSRTPWPSWPPPHLELRRGALGPLRRGSGPGRARTCPRRTSR